MFVVYYVVCLLCTVCYVLFVFVVLWVLISILQLPLDSFYASYWMKNKKGKNVDERMQEKTW